MCKTDLVIAKDVLTRPQRLRTGAGKNALDSSRARISGRSVVGVCGTFDGFELEQCPAENDGAVWFCGWLRGDW